MEEARTVKDFQAADEVFITSSTREIYPVVQIDEARVGRGKVGPWTKKLYASFLEHAAAECGISSCY